VPVPMCPPMWVSIGGKVISPVTAAGTNLFYGLLNDDVNTSDCAASKHPTIRDLRTLYRVCYKSVSVAT
jgi:hypothetical protein